VRLTVSDNGPGIATQDRMRAVQPFVRFGSGAKQEGSGLGLSLVAVHCAPATAGGLSCRSNDPVSKCWSSCRSRVRSSCRRGSP